MHKKLGSLLLACLLLANIFTVPVQAQDGSTYASTITIGTRQMAGNAQIYELLVNNAVVLRYRSAANGYSAAQRANIILQRIRAFGSDLVTKSIVATNLNGNAVVMVAGKLLLTVTEADWEANNTTGPGLARVWTENLNKAINNGNQTTVPPTQPQQTPTPVQTPATGTSISQQEQLMLDLINQERTKAGLKPLQMDPKVVQVARLKSQDMIDKNYFDHTSPTYGDPFTMMRNFGISFGYAGENLAGNQTVEKAHVALMNSPGHRANILNPNYTHVGIGIVKGGPYGTMFTQMFISK